VAGWGAFVFPVLTAFVATLLLRGHQRFSFSNTSIGFGLIFLVVVSGNISYTRIRSSANTSGG